MPEVCRHCSPSLIAQNDKRWEKYVHFWSGGWDIEHSGGFCDATQRYSFDSFDGMLAGACAAVHIWDYIWDSSREPGYYWCAGREAPGTLTLLIIGSITMPHTQTNIQRKRNTLFISFLMKYPRRRSFFQKILLKLIMTIKDISKALPSDVDWVSSYLIVAYFAVGGLHPSHMAKEQSVFCLNLHW